MSENIDRAEAAQLKLDQANHGSADYSRRDYLKFILPSLLGVLFFLTPILVDDKITIGMGILADSSRVLIADELPLITVGLLLLSPVISAILWLCSYYKKYPDSAFTSIFITTPIWLLFRTLGAVFALMTWLQAGPEWIWSQNTGGIVLFDLAPTLITFFFFASLLLPMLVDFGLMEFVGTLVRNGFRKVFQLPGRASIDAVASWIGSGTVGVLITTQQYESGFYSKREAAVIATNFSIASIAFSLVVANFIGIGHLFIEFYATVMIAGIIAAIVTPRLPPLRWKTDDYIEHIGKKIQEDTPADTALFRWSVTQAMSRAQTAPDIRQLLKTGMFNVADIWFGLLPLVMAIGTLALALTEYTHVFVWLSAPLVPLLEWLKIPEAAKAAPALLVGFADMFLPAVVGKNIESELTRFVIAGISMTQLIYMSEVGVLLLKSKIPLNLPELFVIFILRTLITLPVISLIAHWFVF